MTEEEAKQLLQKYLDEKATTAEVKQIEDWYAQLNTPPKHEILEERKLLIREEILGNVKVAIAKKEIKKSFSTTYWLKIAAVVAIVFSISFALWKQNVGGKTPPSETIASTKLGERKKITLNDGSVITLEPLAKIIYPNTFNRSSRKIKLIEGEAFFSIAHEEERPFHVELPSNLNVKVLGTSFRIRADIAKNDIEVAVATGKVAVSNNGKLISKLIKNELLKYSKTTGQSSIHINKHINPVEIEFSGSTLSQVIQRIEYVYSVKISLIDKSLSGLKSTATFNSAQRPEEILDIICSLHHLKFTSDKNHKTFKIYK